MRYMILAALTFAATGASAAQTEPAKSIEPAGRFVFLDQPFEELKLIDPRVMPAARPELRLENPDQLPAWSRPAGVREHSRSLELMWGDIRAATVAVEQARKRLEAGREPRAGERVVDADGGARLRAEYFDRIALLEADLATAERRKARAFSSLIAIRD